MRQVSIGAQVAQLEGLLGCDEVSEWEEGFITSVLRHKEDTTKLTEKQLMVIQRLYNEHFS